MKDKHITLELRKEIKRRLGQCLPAYTPKNCALIKTKEGYKKVEEQIISIMIHTHLPVSSALAQLEME